LIHSKSRVHGHRFGAYTTASSAPTSIVDISGGGTSVVPTTAWNSVESDHKAVAQMNIEIKRAYEVPTEDDGTRILVDRLWPRGLTKQKAKIDLWLKDIAPSTELRKWFAHDPARWTEFKTRYASELRKNNEPLSLLKQGAAKGPVTLIYAARDEEHNEAVILQKLLSRK
jgi:uncharacterized protein YeaO (DUF488 family)